MKILLLLLAPLAFSQSRSVVLAWTDTANPAATQYNVYRASGACTPAPAFAKINATPVTPKTYTDSAMSVGQYCYRVTATLAGLESDPSPSVGAPIAPVAPGQPTITVTVTVSVNP